MNVRLATQILSNSVSVALKNFGPPDATATAVICDMLINSLIVSMSETLWNM